MKEYLLIARGDRTKWDSMSAADWQSTMDGFDRWIKGMKETKQWVRGDRLSPNRVDVKVLDAKPKIVDGPFAETKEAMSGFFIYRAAHLAEAAELAKQCPCLLHDSLELYEMEGDRS